MNPVVLNALKYFKTLANQKYHRENNHKIRALNKYAVPIFTYLFGITEAEIWMTRTIMTKYKQQHPNACKEILKLPREAVDEAYSIYKHSTQNHLIYESQYCFAYIRSTSNLLKQLQPQPNCILHREIYLKIKTF